MDNVKRYSSFIKRITTTKEPIRKKLLKTSNLNIIKAICELLFNIVQKNIVVKRQVLTQLKSIKRCCTNCLKAKVLEQERQF